MDSKAIEELLKKYWNCETSLEEEEQLREYFTKGDVPDNLKETATLFRYFNQQKSMSVSDIEFDKRVTEVLGKGTKKKTKIASLVYTSMRIAAGVAVLLVAIYFLRNQIGRSEQIVQGDTYESPEQAFEETKRALMLISKGFDRAEQQTKKINIFNEAQEKIKSDPIKEEEKEL